MQNNTNEPSLQELSAELAELWKEFHSFKKQITTELEECNKRIDMLLNEGKKVTGTDKDALQSTSLAIEELYNYYKRPVSLVELTSHMSLSKDTTYSRCEKLIELNRIRKYFGRELGMKPSKSAFYSPKISLYDLPVLQSIEDEPQRIIATLLVQLINYNTDNYLNEGVSLEVLVKNSNLQVAIVKKALTTLKQQGFIGTKRTPQQEELYYIIT